MTIIKHIQKLKTKAYTEVENNKKIEEIIRKFESTIKDIDAKSSNLTANHLKKRNEFMSSMNDVAKELATKYDSYELKSIFYYTVEILGNQQFSDFHKKWGEFDAESKLHNIIGTKLEHPMLIIDGYNVKSYLQRFYEDKNKSEISKEARSYFQEFISIGRDDELCNYIYTMASESLGTAKDRKLVDAALTQEMLSSFYKKTIPLSAIRELIEAGTIKKIDIKKTRTFANIGKVKMKEYDVVASSYANNSYFKSDLRDELRDELTKEELFRSFFVCFKNHDHPVSLSASVFNYYCDGQHTISFEEANEIASKSSYFNISSTKAYKSRIDKTFEEDRTRLTKDYQTLSIVNEEFESREGELYVRSVFSSKAFVFHDEIWDGYVKVTEKLLYWKGCKVGNDLLDVNIMGLTRKHQLNAITLFNGIANATSNESLIRDVSSCLDDKLVMALQKHSGLTLKSILDKDSCSFLISQEDPLNKDERLRNYETDKFDILFSDLIYISEYVHLNNFIGENSKQKIKDKINVVTECLMLLDKQSMSLQSAKEEAELIFHENDLSLPSEAIIIDCNYPDWYAEYFDYDKDHVGFIKMSELYNSYEKVAGQYDRNLDFITKDITDLKQVIDCEAKNIYAGLPNNDNNLSFN